mgnify:CR=1 FL=1
MGAGEREAKRVHKKARGDHREITVSLYRIDAYTWQTEGHTCVQEVHLQTPTQIQIQIQICFGTRDD